VSLNLVFIDKIVKSFGVLPARGAMQDLLRSTGNDVKHDLQVDGVFIQGQGVVRVGRWEGVGQHIPEEPATSRTGRWVRKLQAGYREIGLRSPSCLQKEVLHSEDHVVGRLEDDVAGGIVEGFANSGFGYLGVFSIFSPWGGMGRRSGVAHVDIHDRDMERFALKVVVVVAWNVRVALRFLGETNGVDS
jgi:hypothetical protein